MSRVGISLRSCEAIDHPIQPSVGTHNDVRIRIEQEEWRQLGHPVANVASHQEDAVGRDVVGKRNFRDVTDGPGNQEPPKKRSHPDAPRPGIGGIVVCVAFGIIEFFLVCFDVNGPVREFPEINLGPFNMNIALRTFDGHVRQNEFRESLSGETADRIHRHAVSMRIDQPFVHPVL